MNDTSTTNLQPTKFLDYDHAAVANFVRDHCAADAAVKDRAVQLYYAVRDAIRYDPYDVPSSPDGFKASSVVRKGSGYCVAKAVLLAAALRSCAIPARLGFADVTNHLSSPKLNRLMGCNLFIYHGYTEMYLDRRWVKATPAFNKSLCSRFHVQPLEFSGDHDSLFHPYDAKGRKHMEYVRDHGSFADLPCERIISAYRKQYPGMFERLRELAAGPPLHDPLFAAGTPGKCPPGRRICTRI